MKTLPQTEEILLNNLIPIYKTTFRRKSIFTKTPQTIRWYIPNWNKIINDGHLFNLLIDKKIILPQQRKFKYSLIQVYLLLTFLPTPNARRENYTGRRNRVFNLKTLLFDPENNEKLLAFDTGEHWKVKKYLRSISQTEKKRQLENILKKKVYPWLDTGTPIKDLISTAFIERPIDLPLSRMGDEYYTTKVFDNAIKILSQKFIDRDLVGNPLSMKDIKYIQKNLLPDPIIEELRDKKLNSLLEKFEEPYKKICDLIDGQKRNGNTRVIIDITIYKNEFLTITQALIDYLKAKKNRKFNKHKIDDLNELINFVLQMRDLPDKDKWKGLLIIRDRFYKQTESLYHFVNKLEKEVKYYLRTFSLLIRNEVVKKENLNRPEVRLYIISNLGLPSTDYSQVIFERGLFEFLNFHELIYPFFIEVNLNREKTYQNLDLREFLEFQFRIFLKFYPFWHNEIKRSEQIRKRDTREKKQTKPLDTAHHKDKNNPNPIVLADLIGCEEELLKICSTRELEIFKEKQLYYKTLVKIAEEQKVSPQMIGRIYNRAKRKINKFYSK